MKPHYFWEKTYAAVRSLVGILPIKERLIYAYGSLLPLKTVDVPEEFQEELRDIMSIISAVEDDGFSGKINIAVRRMTEEEAFGVALKILSLYDSVTRHMNPH